MHVKGAVHGPNGLLCRPRQPDNLEEDDDDEFDNWIDKLHGFMHMLQPIGQSIIPQLFVLTQPELSVKAQSPHDPMPMYDDNYSQVPHTLQLMQKTRS